MIESTRKAARRLNPDPSSWSKRKIEHRAYRQIPLLPEEEAPPHRRSRKKRKRHVHKWGPWILLREELRYNWWLKKRERNVRVYFHESTCERCGLKMQRRSDHRLL